MANYLGTATGNTGIPSLLISTLQQVQDPDIQKALYQIQDWANSFFSMVQLYGAGTGVAFGANNGPALMQFDSDVKTTNGLGQATSTFPKPFKSSVATIVCTSGDSSAYNGVITVQESTVSLTQFSWIAGVSGSVRCNWIAIGT